MQNKSNKKVSKGRFHKPKKIKIGNININFLQKEKMFLKRVGYKLVKLHIDKELFGGLIEATANELGINPLYVEKDYWITVARAFFKSDENYSELKVKIRHLYDIHFLLQQESIKLF